MSACAVRTKEIGGLALLGERYRRFGRSACCGGVLSSKGRGSVKCKARALGTIALLKRLSLAALGIDPKALKASRTIDPLPLPSLDSAKCLSTVDYRCCCCSTQRAPTLRTTPKHRSHFREKTTPLSGKNNTPPLSQWTEVWLADTTRTTQTVNGRMWEKRRRRPTGVRGL